MRTRIEIYETDKPYDKYGYTVDMAVGAYGRYENVGSGFQATEVLAEAQAIIDGEMYLKKLIRSRRPIKRKYVNLEVQ